MIAGLTARAFTCTAPALLHYQTLLRATVALTRDHREVVEMVRRMVFNVLACVRDDHSKNFAWLMSDAGEWQLSPAFDLTFSHGISGHHTTSVLGEGRYPTWQMMWQLADEVAVGQRVFRDICDEAAHAVGAFDRISTTLKVPAALRRPIVKAPRRDSRAARLEALAAKTEKDSALTQVASTSITWATRAQLIIDAVSRITPSSRTLT